MNLINYQEREIRFTEERLIHLEDSHPEMKGQFELLKDTILLPDVVIQSKFDEQVELYYKYFLSTPIGSKYLCVVVKINEGDNFIITAYFTEAIKKGKLLWEKK